MGFEAANQHLASRGVPSTKFDNYGDTVTGVLVDGDVQPQTDPATGAVKFKKDGVTPVMQLVITWDTDQRSAQIPNDKGRRKLYCSWRLEAEIKRAVRTAGAEGLEVGGNLTVTYTREERVEGQMGKAKIYEASYVPPTKVIGGSVNSASDTIPEEKKKTVRDLWDADQPISLITQVTGLTEDEVESVIGAI